MRTSLLKSRYSTISESNSRWSLPTEERMPSTRRPLCRRYSQTETCPFGAKAQHLANALFLPDWLPDESLFSLVSRYHGLSGNRLASHTCLELFGHAHQGSQHDFPTRLGYFAEVTGEALGDARTIVQRRTILPFFLRLLTPERAEGAVRALEGANLGGLKFQLGLLTSRFRAHHPLKACPTCLLNDSDVHGTPYWHMSHQYPGVWVCPEHGIPLQESTVKSSGVGRFLWHLPHECTLTAPRHQSAQPTAQELDALLSFAVLIREFSRLPLETSINATQFQLLVMSRLKELDLATPTNRLRLTDITSAYASAIEPLASVPELSQLYRSDPNFSSTLGKLLRPPRGGTHPLRQLALIYWLFGSCSGFVERSGNAVIPGGTEAYIARPLATHRTEPLRREFLACVTLGASPTFCAKTVGIDVSTGLIWAAQQGLIVRHRRKAITDATIKGIAKDLRAGLDKEAVAYRHQVSSSTINRLLASIRGLQAEWRTAMHHAARTKARHVWHQALMANPAVGIKELRKQNAAAFAWLYRNDKAWLIQANTAIPRRPTQPLRTRVDWPARDKGLAAKVCEAIQQLSAASPDPHRKVHLWQLYQRVPDLKAKLGVLEKMPLTMAVIQRATTGEPS